MLTPLKALILAGARWTLSFSTHSTFCFTSRDDRYGQSLGYLRQNTTSQWEQCQTPPNDLLKQERLCCTEVEGFTRLKGWVIDSSLEVLYTVRWPEGSVQLSVSQGLVKWQFFFELLFCLKLVPYALCHKWRITWRFDHWSFTSFQKEVFACFIE